MAEDRPSPGNQEQADGPPPGGATEPLLHLDDEGTIRLATPAAGRLLALDVVDLIDHPFIEFAVTDKLEKLDRLLRLVATGQTKPRTIEVVCRRGEAQRAHLEIAMARSTEEGSFPLVLRLVDVGQRRATGARDRKKLRWFRALTEHSGDVIVVADGDGRHTFVSGAASGVLGCAPDEFDRQGWLDRMHPQDRARVVKQLDEVAACEGEHRKIAYRLRHTDGHFLHVETRAINQLEHPDIRGVVFYIHDVGDRILRDPITGLPKRRRFLDRLDEVISERHRRAPFAVLLMSLDRHKQVKNGLGPRFADEMMGEYAERTRDVLEGRAMLARLTDGELVALVDGVATAEDASRIAARLRSLCAAPFKLAGQTVHSDVAVGISLSARGYTRSDAMLRDASSALAGAAAGQGATVANTKLIQRVSRRLILESDLRRAIDKDALCLHYQPIFDLVNGSIRGFEALVRWEHPRRGLLSPAMFVPLAEETGLITAMDSWVVTAAARQLSRWRERGLGEEELYVNINLSGRAVQGEGPLAELEEAVTTCGLGRNQLRIELTESALVERPDEAAAILETLRRRGFEVALDDFGTGYSSFAYLSRFAFDTLKIDQSFVSGPNGLEASSRTLKLVRAILELGKSLGVSIVAEGIENAVQAGRLRAMGCKLGQGYHLGRPAPAGQAGALLAGEQKRGA